MKCTLQFKPRNRFKFHAICSHYKEFHYSKEDYKFFCVLQASGIKTTIWEECCKAKEPSGTVWAGFSLHLLAEADEVRVLIKTTIECFPGLPSVFRSEQLLCFPRNNIFCLRGPHRRMESVTCST